MNYHNITSPDMLNGSGLRTVLWVSGCTHKCPGCHNPETHPFDSGIPFDQFTMDEILDRSKFDYISGLTLSGGDPFMPQNVSDCYKIASIFHKEFPNKTIWAYTGYKYEQLLDRPDALKLLKYVDVLVDGQFQIKNKNSLLHFRGSSNQRIIDIKKSTKDNVIIMNL